MPSLRRALKSALSRRKTRRSDNAEEDVSCTRQHVKYHPVPPRVLSRMGVYTSYRLEKRWWVLSLATLVYSDWPSDSSEYFAVVSALTPVTVSRLSNAINPLWEHVLAQLCPLMVRNKASLDHSHDARTEEHYSIVLRTTAQHPTVTSWSLPVYTIASKRLLLHRR